MLPLAWALGIRPGDRIAVLSEEQTWWSCSLAILSLGASMFLCTTQAVEQIGTFS